MIGVKASEEHSRDALVGDNLAKQQKKLEVPLNIVINSIQQPDGSFKLESPDPRIKIIKDI